MKNSALLFRAPDVMECTVTRRSHRMQKHKFGVTGTGALFVETAPGHPSVKKSAPTFHTLDAPECTT
jgi:hypothetical protein